MNKENIAKPIYRVFYALVSLLAWFVIIFQAYTILENNLFFSVESLQTLLIIIFANFTTYVAIYGHAPKWCYYLALKNPKAKDN